MTIERLRAAYDTMTIMAFAIPVSAAAMLGVTLVAGEPLLPPTADGWLVLLGVALVSQVFGQGLIAYGLAQLPCRAPTWYSGTPTTASRTSASSPFFQSRRCPRFRSPPSARELGMTSPWREMAGIEAR